MPFRMSLLIMTLVAAACGPGAREDSARQAQPAASPEAAATARRTIIPWLECEECTEGQLEAVLKLGNAAIPTLTATLMQGPSPVRLDEHRQHLRAQYQQQVQYGRSHPAAAPELSEKEHLVLYAGNLLARYRTRSALALERIGGPAAAEALGKAVKLPLRSDERVIIEAAASRVR